LRREIETKQNKSKVGSYLLDFLALGILALGTMTIFSFFRFFRFSFSFSFVLLMLSQIARFWRVRLCM
jgi:uncharacterized membrane protein YqjE